MGADGKRVVNLFTQEAAYHHGESPGGVSVQHVGHALRELIDTEKFGSVALPRLATGVGGLDWHDVQPLVQQHLGELKVPVIVYSTYRANLAAAEGL
jgi:O-acetyl-ADP-ribose deacetylase (regulator of RNase III)